MSTRPSLCLVALLGVVVAAPGWAVPMGSTASYQGHQYVLLSEATWLDAEADAAAWGGHLTAINDAAEQNWLIDTFGGSLFWIGLSDYQHEGTFTWSNGDAVTFTSWDYDEPNNSDNDGASPEGEDFVELNRFGSGLWNDLPIWSTRVGIAERCGVPEPGTLRVLGAGMLMLVAVRRRVSAQDVPAH